MAKCVSKIAIVLTAKVRLLSDKLGLLINCNKIFYRINLQQLMFEQKQKTGACIAFLFLSYIQII